jgi:uncharacterized damage-inducible protein DinB
MSGELIDATKAALIGELEALHESVRQVAEPLTERELWAKPIEPGNSIGHLILHLTGNLNHFVGAQLGGTGYRRDREREFTDSQPPPKAMVLANLADAVTMFRRVVGGLRAEQLVAPYPEERFGTVVNMLVHLVAHFALHRGQMSYLLRLVKPEK